jgi:creatinine amidohydrolase
MAGRPYVLEEVTWKTVRKAKYQVAILPWGAVEAHNYHLPFGTDNIEVKDIAVEAARLAWHQEVRVLVLPTIPLGVNTQQLDIPHTLNLNPSTQALVLADVVESLEAQGMGKLLVLNGHGGNDFKQMIRELQVATDVFLCTLDWWRIPLDGEIFEDRGDHGGEMETSLMMHLTPGLVLPLEEAGPGREHRFRVPALREGWAWAPRNWSKATEDTGVGDPSPASADKGAAFFNAVTGRIAQFLIDLAAADPNDLYE